MVLSLKRYLASAKNISLEIVCQGFAYEVEEAGPVRDGSGFALCWGVNCSSGKEEFGLYNQRRAWKILRWCLNLFLHRSATT